MCFSSKERDAVWIDFETERTAAFIIIPIMSDSSGRRAM